MVRLRTLTLPFGPWPRPDRGVSKGGRWAADWWRYPEAIVRLGALWRSWEHLRQDGATGSSIWWRDHLDHHTPILMDVEGSFAEAKDPNDPGEALPYTPPPEGMFPDVRTPL